MERARMVLLAHAGQTNHQIAKALRTRPARGCWDYRMNPHLKATRNGTADYYRKKLCRR